MIERICVIASSYPQARSPERGAFIQKLVSEWEDNNLKVDVVAPKSIPNTIRCIVKRKHEVQSVADQIERPYYMSFPKKKIGPISLKRIARNNYLKAAQRGVNKVSIPDLYYGKFLMSGGYAAMLAAQKFNKPVIVDLGESKLIERFNEEELEIAKKIVPNIDGFACVSQRLINEIIELGAKPENILYAPNTVDTEAFYPMDSYKCREKVGLPKNGFIVSFIGHFINRKGPLRVLEAINMIDDLPVKGIFMGEGNETPKGDNVLHVGSVPNKELPFWLNASDVFVLPTLAEGYCNAINEALACGVPIISSDIEDVRHQVTDDMGILVNPHNTIELAKAITNLLGNKVKLEEMGQECVKVAKIRFEKSRGVRILEWLRKKSISKN